MRIAVAGVTGRMGRAVLTAVTQRPDMTLTAALSRSGSASCGRDVGFLIGVEPTGIVVTDDPEGAIAGCDIFIDFTQPESTLVFAEICAKHEKRAVIGTTGLPAATVERLRQLSGRAGFVVAANMSVGVTLALHLLETAAGVLHDADVEIFEAHHRHKIDAPSGTALRMGEVVAKARGQTLPEVAVYDRHAQRAPRPSGAIGFASVRAGEIVGEHRAFFALPAERLEIAHIAENRQVFADGALRAARFLLGRGCGFFDMQDVLGLR